MNILFTRFPLESRFGGAEVQTLSLMKGLKERGHEVEFLGSCELLLREASSFELRAIRLEIGKPPVTKWQVISFLWRKNSMKKKLLQSLATSHYSLATIVMLSLTEKLLITEELAKRGHPVFWIEHDRVGRWLTMNPWLPLMKRMSQFATMIVVSELSKKIYVDLGFNPQRIVVIPNGIDLERLQPANTTHYPLPATSFSVGSILRLTPDKGADVLIAAVADMPEVNLSIIGSGSEEGFLRKIISDHHLEDRITIRPHTDDLASFYSSLDAFVLPSREHDPFGLVAAEAMSMGIPTIVTDQCGIAGYLHDGTDSLIVPAESSGALKQAISKLMHNEILYTTIAEQGKRIALQQFDVNMMINCYEALLKSS